MHQRSGNPQPDNPGLMPFVPTSSEICLGSKQQGLPRTVQIRLNAISNERLLT